MFCYHQANYAIVHFGFLFMMPVVNPPRCCLLHQMEEESPYTLRTIPCANAKFLEHALNGTWLDCCVA